MIVVKEAFTYIYGYGGWVRVPAGARTKKNIDDPRFRWVDPSIFPAGSLDRHDAEHYGIRVPLSNTEDREP